MPILDQYPMPLIAILRGLTPADAEWVGHTLFDAGFRLLEVPLNRPGALDAMRILLRRAPADAVIGGGTMLNRAHVDAVGEAGGRMMVSPNCNTDVIRYAVEKGMLVLPGVATPSEAFSALDAGAHGVKLFPAEMITPAVLKAIYSIMPPGTILMPVGGINPQNMAAYAAAGANGFGIGSALYKPGVAPDALKNAAMAFMQAREAIRKTA
ncbi:MAG: 2-dehydro-3-deoxy-6-phosphogalactonate aldolase [Herminiimonas sp.]|nr:2-dehydro-3-deoxy-6-phosphogalactonate aldolase [Herminiimonas sp.]